ncbi:MAG: Crp/Fnr family transcriptional regulator [Ignavibacteria bacterium]|nr:Crp/Fnr family transcriptional regulator [Ignavibacteria bacterium]
MFEKFSDSFLKDFDLNFLIDRFNKNNFHTFLKGDKIVSQGNSPADVFFILTGNIEAGTELPDGNFITKYELSAGDILGIDDVLRDENYVYTAFAASDTNVMIISKEEFISVTGKNDEFNIWLLKYLSKRIGKFE